MADRPTSHPPALWSLVSAERDEVKIGGGQPLQVLSKCRQKEAGLCFHFPLVSNLEEKCVSHLYKSSASQLHSRSLCTLFLA